jgi:hypothetical protein
MKSSLREMRNVYKVVIGKSEEERNLGDMGLHERILLKYVLEKRSKVLWARFMCENRDHVLL